MSEVLKFLNNLQVRLTEEEMIECFKQDVSDEEIKEAKQYLRDLGFDLKNFCVSGSVSLQRVFSKIRGVRDYEEKVREAVVKIQSTFSTRGPFHAFLKLLYAVGFSNRDIIFLLYRIGFRGISEKSIENNISRYRHQFNDERKKFMELIECTKATVFQELQEEIKSTERKTALIYIKALEKINTELEDVDVILEPTKWNRLTKQADALQAKLNAMHHVQEHRSAVIQTAAKISLLKAAKSIEDGDSKKDNFGDTAKTIESDGEIISPFKSEDNKVIAAPMRHAS